MELQNLFAQARVEKGKPYNFLKMVGGRYQIDTKDPFLKLFVQNLFTQKISDGGLLFKVPKSVLYPIIIDIDLDLSANLTHDVEKDYYDLASQILPIFQSVVGNEEVEVLMSRRPEPSYQKKEHLWRAGCHLYILGSYSLSVSRTIRQKCLEAFSF